MGRVEILDAKIYYTEVRRRKLSGPLSINTTWKSDVIYCNKTLKDVEFAQHDSECGVLFVKYG